MADEQQAATIKQQAAEAGAMQQGTNKAPARQQGGPQQRGGRRPNGQNRDRGQAAEPKEFDEQTLNIDRVARVIKGGRRFRFRALVVVGDRKGKVGIGSSKGADVTSAITKATDVAKKNMVKVNLYKGTLPHEATAKVSGANILVMPASPGTGLIAGGAVRTILEVAGVKDAMSKSLGSTNKTNIAYATVKALESIVPASEWVTTRKKADAKPAIASKPKAKPAAKKAEK